MSDAPMTVRIEASGSPYDVKVTAEDGQALEVEAVKWECSVTDPVPRATIHMGLAAASFETRPSVVLAGMGGREMRLPDGLTTAQVLDLQARFGPLSAELEHAYKQRARLLREMEARGVDTRPMLETPEADMPPVRAVA